MPAKAGIHVYPLSLSCKSCVPACAGMTIGGRPGVKNDGRWSYNMSTQIHRDRKVYYDKLEATQNGDLDATLWLTCFLRCLGRAVDDAAGMLAAIFRKAHFWERCVDVSLNPRQRDMVKRLLDGFVSKLTSSKWAVLTKCSQDTALRDIDGLIASGVLIKDAAGGRSTSYALAE